MIIKRHRYSTDKA